MPLDWELARVGPPQWDHVPLLIHVRRFGADPRCYDLSAAGYGDRFDAEDPTEAMCQHRELTIRPGQLRRAATGVDPADTREAQRRLAYWARPGPRRGTARWTAR